MTLEQFVVDRLRLYATVRALEIISEASRRLPDDLKQRHPEVAWRDIAAAGNIYRHGYEGVIPELIWGTARNDLGTLRKAVEFELGR